MKFTFKRYPRPSGLAIVAHRDSYEIKLKGKKVGRIGAGGSAGFMVLKEKEKGIDDGNPNCPWMWIFFETGGSCEDAMKWANDNVGQITSQYKLYEIKKNE